MEAVFVERAAWSRRLESSRDRRLLLILTTMTLVALGLALWATRGVAPLRGDSAEYLYFDPSRTVGYPAFLSFIRLATGHVALAVPAQMTLLAGSLLFLAWSFYGLAGRPPLSLGFCGLLLAQGGMWFAAAFLMTEALSTALVAVWCAQLLRATRSLSMRRAAALVLISALATMVRPSLASLFLGSALFLLVCQPPAPRGKALALAGAGLVLAWTATPIAQFLVHGTARTTSPFARGVLQHTLYCDPHRVPLDADAQFVEASSAEVRRYIDAAPAGMREQFRRAYSTPLRFGLIIPVLGHRHQLDRRSQVDRYLSPIAWQRVGDNPACYASSVAGEYLRMAVFATDPTVEDARPMAAFMRGHPPVELPQFRVLPGDERIAYRAAREVRSTVAGLNPPRQRLDVVAKVPLIALLPVRLIYGAAALIGLLSILLLPIRQPLARPLRQIIPPAAAMGLALHATLAITAVVEIGFYRYLVPLWPLVCTLIAVTGLRLADARRLLQRRDQMA